MKLKKLKNLIKSSLCLLVAIVCAASFSACKTKVSSTTSSTSGVSSNGGITAIYNGYLYFINGTKTNDGTSSSGNTRSAICRVKISDDGVVDGSTYEVLVDDLVGFDYGSIYFFGDFMYYTTPNANVNYVNSVLYYQTKFMRYDLVYGKSYEVYTTKQNSSSESISYAYYIVAGSLNLVVFESTNATLTSIKIEDKISTNYVLSNIKSVVLSENYGTASNGNSVDANNFVFYTKSNEASFDTTFDQYQTGVQVYMISPTDSSKLTCLSNEGKSVSLLSIRNGKLIYSCDSYDGENDIIYYETITGTNDTLTMKNVLSYTSYEDILFMEEDDGSVTILCYDSDNSELLVLTRSASNPYEIETTVINREFVSKSDAFSILTVVTLEEEEKVKTEDNGETNGDSGEDAGSESGEGAGESSEANDGSAEEVTVTYKVKYLLYLDDSYLYKVEIGRYDENGEFSYTTMNTPISLSNSKLNEATNLLIPEVVGDYIYIFAKEITDDSSSSDKVYLYRVDLTATEDVAEAAEFIGIKE